ncbi:SDR family NAD(P)-dependent oxidoreductase [Sphingopyxis solisilvae]|uniref:SDR family NAD(P)-dependent oxidoreductase n=1 Tax=Sphingopyxis solisilvae TaxID=1886788 RepID=UPI001892AEB9|nr:SDR family NAD(P)-dependent oxidoreductase [Sphingopyxis solisilvae]
MLENLPDLSGRSAVISGAGRGLGAALAIRFADMGIRPILCGRGEAALLSVRAAISERTGLDAPVILLDLSDPASIEQAAGQIESLAIPVDLLVNNGAMWLDASETPASAAQVLATVNAAITGTFLLTDRLLPLLGRSKAPDVVTIGSISGLPNAPLHSAAVPFYAAKRGQTAIAEGLRQRLRGSGIRSMIVHPPYLDDALPTDESWDAAATRTKGERATTRDVVEAVLFAITRPRHISLDIILDADEGGLFG